MNKMHHITNQAELEQLIERYFDGETSLQEEQTLRQALADCPWSSDIIDEAKFTLGYFAAHKHQQRHIVNMTARRRFIGIAASIAVLLTIGGAFLWKTQQSQGECIAYVNGKAITSDDAVMALIEKDLNTMDMATHEMDNAIADDMNEMGIATSQMTDELSSLGEAIELD